MYEQETSNAGGFVAKPGAGKWVLKVVVASAFSLVIVYAVLAMISASWLRVMVPVSDADLKHATWLVQPPPFYLTSLALVGLLLLVATGLALMAARGLRGPKAGNAGLIVLAFGLLGLPTISPETALRSAVFAGEAKVGCYDYTSRDCAEKLGLLSSTASEARAKHLRQMLPPEVMALIRAPYDLFNSDRIDQMLFEQRQEVKAETLKAMKLRPNSAQPTSNLKGDHHE